MATHIAKVFQRKTPDLLGELTPVPTDFQLVAQLESEAEGNDLLEEAFMATNSIELPWQQNPFGCRLQVIHPQARNTSVGDIVTADNTVYCVGFFGWDEIPLLTPSHFIV